jgi:hypothetical protein
MSLFNENVWAFNNPLIGASATDPKITLSWRRYDNVHQRELVKRAKHQIYCLLTQHIDGTDFLQLTTLRNKLDEIESLLLNEVLSAKT